MLPETLESMKAHAIAEFPRECCGLLIVFKGRERYLPCENKSDAGPDTFVISSEQYAAAEERGEIVAVVHSHPNHSAQPSMGDKVACENSGLAWHILSVMKQPEQEEPTVNDVVTISPNGYKAPLVGRQFVHGILDCYSLVRDWYREELGIELPDYEREVNWWEKDYDLYADNFEAAGFVPAKGEMQVGDIILMQLRAKKMNHAAVYLGDGLILHHVQDRLSSRDVYGGYWQEVTRMVVRKGDSGE